MMTPFKTIAVVTPCRNAADTIERTLLSVAAQAGDFILRFHVQDGESTDGTVELLERWQTQLESGAFPIQCRGLLFSYDSCADRGMYDALVKGFGSLTIAPSDFMTWVNADDLLMPGALSLVSNVANSFTDDQVAWLGGMPFVMRGDTPIAQVDRPLPTSAIREGLCDGKFWDFVQQEGTFFRRWLWDVVDPARNLASYRFAGDWNLWRLFASYTQYVQVQWPLGSFRLREGQLSHANFDTYMAEIEATVASDKRSKALRSIAETQTVTRRLLKARYPSGQLFVTEETVDSSVDHFYRKNFGNRPPRSIDANYARQSEYQICQERERLESMSQVGAASTPNVWPPKPEFFGCYSYAKRSHWKHFEGLDVELFGEKKDPDREQLKVYQDLLVLRFIRDNIPQGARILDVGGGNSRILTHLNKSYECWNIDKLEGVGNGPHMIKDPPYRLVRDYMGNFNAELPNDYFDLVFSISALEHVPQNDTTLFDKIIADINRVLKSGGMSLHLFDIVLKPDSYWTNKFTQHIFNEVDTISKSVTPDEMRIDSDFYAMSEKAYNDTWLHTVRKSYSDHGRPSSLNILWRKEQPTSGAEMENHSGSDNLQLDSSRLTNIVVVTPCLNVASTIDKTIESVITQEGRFFIRYHVQDGGSTDGTLERLRKWEWLIRNGKKYEHVSFSWQSAPDRSMYDALSFGFDRVRALPDDLLTWVNGDDVLMPGAFECVVRIMSVHPEVQWIGGARRVIDNNDQVIDEHDIPLPTVVIREGLCDGEHLDFLQQEGTFFRKALWFRAKHALRGFRYAGDWSLWREFARHAEYYYIRKPLGAFRKRAGQLSVMQYSEYLLEIEDTISIGERRKAFEALYAERNTLASKVVHVTGLSDPPVVESCHVDSHFERLATRAGLN